MFPIRNRKGQVIGFGARSIHPEDQPKYLNSPETPVFHKGSEAYGLYELRQHKGLPDKILITEGYMDVIALVQFGIWFAVATLGTATSKTHIEILLKQSRHLIFSFDGDRAGKEAAWRALQVCLPLMTGDYKIEFLFLPQEHDPDSFIREQGVEVFLEQLGQAFPLSQVLLSHLEEKYPLVDIESRAQFVRAAIPYISKLPKGPYLELLLAAIAEKTGMEKSQIAYQLSEAIDGQEVEQSGGRSFQKPVQQGGSLDLVEYVISWIIQFPSLVEKLEFPEMTHHSPMVDVLLEVVAYIRLHPKVSTGALLAQSVLSQWSSWLGELAMIDHHVSPEVVILELQESLKKISKERDEKMMNVLIEKSRRQPLTPEEKEKISDFLKKNRQ
jgi:DNA primase